MPDITRTQTRHNNPQICRAGENTAITQSLKEEKMSGREREVVLEGGPPWGFRITGGSDTVQDLKVERGGEGWWEGSRHHLIIVVLDQSGEPGQQGSRESQRGRFDQLYQWSPLQWSH